MDSYDIRPSKRPRRSRSPSPSSHYNFKPYRSSRHDSGTHSRPDSRSSFRPHNNSNSNSLRSAKDLIRLNALQEDERMRQYVAGEDAFVLKQSKLKAQIRVKEGRARCGDWFVVLLKALEGDQGGNEGAFDEMDEEESELREPENVLDEVVESDMGSKALEELVKDVESYEKLETRREGRDFWRTVGVVVRDRQRSSRMGNNGAGGRATGAVKSDIDKLLRPKTYEQLEGLEEQIREKLDGDEPIDTDYWGQLLDSLLVWKAKAKLAKVWRDVMGKRMEALRKEQKREAERARIHLTATLGEEMSDQTNGQSLEPDPLLSVAAKDKGLQVIDESIFLANLTAERQKVIRQGYIPLLKPTSTSTFSTNLASTALSSTKPTTTTTTNINTNNKKDSITTAFDKLVARGVDEDEEVFAAEETSPSSLTSTTNLRKPLYFNRVALGYDWNKYNQTHYDADNPPPRVVQGYKFHIFYPDLPPYTPTSSGPPIPTKAPTYRIHREHSRRKGESLAAAGEEDYCIIRFTAGPPYEDVAFRIVDRDWDYSGKEGRGFKSVFSDGVLSLWFSFRRVYYRK